MFDLLFAGALRHFIAFSASAYLHLVITVFNKLLFLAKHVFILCLGTKRGNKLETNY